MWTHTHNTKINLQQMMMALLKCRRDVRLPVQLPSV